jgi:hypothetical protein
MNSTATESVGHSHVFLGTGHEQNERKAWAVIVSRDVFTQPRPICDRH